MSDVIFDTGVVTPWYPFTEEPIYNVLKSNMASGTEQRRLIYDSPRRRFTVKFSLLSRTDMDIVKAFFNARRGEYDAFYFPNNNDRVTDEAIGDKAPAATYTCSAVPIGNYTVSDVSGKLVENTDYSVVKMTGVITFINAVTTAVVSFDPCVYCRFDGTMTFTELFKDRFQTEMSLIEVF